MIAFVTALLGLILLTVVIQVITKMKIVGGNELGIVSGKGTGKGFRAISGGRVFIIPLINRFAKINLTPHTIEVPVESAIASGVVPLNVKATVSFAIASNEAGRSRAVTRILSLAKNWEELRKVASDIIEGHLRDSIASLTPEQVMKDKDKLVARMINVCKNDLENIGLEITTMNIADVDDHRLEGVDEPDLYIALLKRVQSANAQAKARIARADAKAAAVEQEESRRAEVEVRRLENQYEQLVADTRVRVKEENQRKTVGVREAQTDGEARVAGLKAELEAEKQRIEMLGSKFEAEIETPAEAERERAVLQAKGAAAKVRARAQAEIDELKRTLEIIKGGGSAGRQTYVIENFGRLIEPFAETLRFFPVKRLSVITGAEGRREPISAIHPDAVEREKNELLAGALSEALRTDGAAAGATAGAGGAAGEGDARASDQQRDDTGAGADA